MNLDDTLGPSVTIRKFGLTHCECCAYQVRDESNDVLDTTKNLRDLGFENQDQVVKLTVLQSTNPVSSLACKAYDMFEHIVDGYSYFSVSRQKGKQFMPLPLENPKVVWPLRHHAYSKRLTALAVASTDSVVELLQRLIESRAEPREIDRVVRLLMSWSQKDMLSAEQRKQIVSTCRSWFVKYKPTNLFVPWPDPKVSTFLYTPFWMGEYNFGAISPSKTRVAASCRDGIVLFDINRSSRGTQTKVAWFALPGSLAFYSESCVFFASTMRGETHKLFRLDWDTLLVWDVLALTNGASDVVDVDEFTRDDVSAHIVGVEVRQSLQNDDDKQQQQHLVVLLAVYHLKQTMFYVVDKPDTYTTNGPRLSFAKIKGLVERERWGLNAAWKPYEKDLKETSWSTVSKEDAPSLMLEDTSVQATNLAKPSPLIGSVLDLQARKEQDSSYKVRLDYLLRQKRPSDVLVNVLTSMEIDVLSQKVLLKDKTNKDLSDKVKRRLSARTNVLPKHKTSVKCFGRTRVKLVTGQTTCYATDFPRSNIEELARKLNVKEHQVKKLCEYVRVVVHKDETKNYFKNQVFELVDRTLDVWRNYKIGEFLATAHMSKHPMLALSWYIKDVTNIAYTMPPDFGLMDDFERKLFLRQAAQTVLCEARSKCRKNKNKGAMSCLTKSTQNTTS